MNLLKTQPNNASHRPTKHDHRSDVQMIYVCAYQSIACFAPLEDDSTSLEKENRGETSGPAPALIPCKLPSVGFERIKKVMCSMNYVRVLSEEGRVYKIGFDLGISTIVYEKEIDTNNLFIEDMSCFTHGVLYLARERTNNLSSSLRGKKFHKKPQTYLYGGCKNFFNNLGVTKGDSCGNLDEEDFRLLFTPEQDFTITHIATGFSFSVCVINNTDLHYCSTNCSWQDKRFSTPRPILEVACSGFTCACILQDYSVMIENSKSELQLLQIPSHSQIDRVYGGYDSFIFRAKCDIPSLGQYFHYCCEKLEPLSKFFHPENWTRKCHWSEAEFEFKKDVLMLNFIWDRPSGFYFVGTSENDSNKFIDLGSFFHETKNRIKCSFTNHTVAFYVVPPTFDLKRLLRKSLSRVSLADIVFHFK
nr:unnamed protein product [Naegleria fowleri]